MSRVFKTGDRVYFRTKDGAHFNEYEMQIASFMDNEHVWVSTNHPTINHGKVSIKDLTTDQNEAMWTLPDGQVATGKDIADRKKMSAMRDKLKIKSRAAKAYENSANAPNFLQQAAKANESFVKACIDSIPGGVQMIEKKCECGASAVGIDKHSTWCPLHGGE